MQKIAALRAEKGITQEELANATGISLRTIQRIELGQVKPRAYSLKKIAQALQVEFSALHQPGSSEGVTNLKSLLAGGHKQLLTAVFYSGWAGIVFILLLLNISSQLLGARFMRNSILFINDFHTIHFAVSAACIFALSQAYRLFIRKQVLHPASYWALLALFSALCMYLAFSSSYVSAAYLPLNNIQLYMAFTCWLMLLFIGVAYNPLFKHIQNIQATA